MSGRVFIFVSSRTVGAVEAKKSVCDGRRVGMDVLAREVVGEVDGLGDRVELDSGRTLLSVDFRSNPNMNMQNSAIVIKKKNMIAYSHCFLDCREHVVSSTFS